MKTMDPEEVRRLIEGQPNILQREAEEEAQFFKNLACPLCHSYGCQPRARPPKVQATPEGPMVVQSSFSPDRALVRSDAYCIECGTLFDPYTRVIQDTEASMIHGPIPDLPPGE